MADQVQQSSLSKEVLPPQKPSSGFGVLMVASLAMFFAIASSAFVLRARMVRTCPGAERAPLMMLDHKADHKAAPGAAQEGAEWQEHARECGTPEYRTNPDGSTTVFFEVCPSDKVQGIFTISETLPSSVEVHQIR